MLRRPFPPPALGHVPRPKLVARIGALAAFLVLGVLAAGTSAFSATPADDCPLPPVCPVVPVPTLPEVSVPGLTTTSPSDPAPDTGPAGATGGGASPTAPVPTGEAAVLTYVVRASVRKKSNRRWIDLRLSLSHPATVVAILQRAQVPLVAAVRTGRPGANAFVVSLPRRVRAGRYALKLVLATANSRRTVTRALLVPK